MANNKNNLRKIIAVMLAATMSVSHTGMLNVFADGETPLLENPAAVESGSGTLEDPFIIEVELIESSTDPIVGETTTITESESEWFGAEEKEGGYTTIEGQEESESTVVTDEEGNILEGSGSTEGSEVKIEESYSVNDGSEPIEGEENEPELSEPVEGEEVVVEQEEPVVDNKEVRILDPVKTGEEIIEGEESKPEPVGDLTPVGEPERVGEEEVETETVVVENADNISVELKPGENKEVSADNNDELLAAYKAALEAELPEGSEIKALYNENNEFVGYEIVTKGEISEESAPVAEGDPVVGEWSEAEFSPTGNIDFNYDWEGVVVEETEEIILPEKPEASESVNEESGEKTVVTVNEIYDPNDSSKVIGYSKTTIVTDAEGNQLSSANENLYGTVVTKVTTEYTDQFDTEESATQNRTVTQTYVSSAEQKIINEEIKWNELDSRTVEASMSAVEGGEGHGGTDTTSIKPEGVADVYTGRDLPTAKELKDFAFKFVDNALSSDIRVNTSEGDIKAHQFILVDAEGKIHVALCADFDTNARDGYRYDMVNVTEATYYDDEAAEMIVAIAHSGFWGTADAAEGEAENLGSLAAVKEFLKENSNLSAEQINKLTKDEALTATQAALWKFGNHEESSLYEKNIAGGNNISSESKARVQALFNALVNIDPKKVESINNNNPVLATEDTFATSSTITVGDKSSDEKYAEVNSDEDPENDVYDTTIEFTMAFEPTENDDLLVKILDPDGNVLEERRLAGAAKNEEEGFIKRIFKGENQDETVYVIENVQLAEGVNITLNLSGTQNLGQGVYLYSSEIKGNVSSQTFVGIAEGTREVNLNVDMNFKVHEAKVEYHKTSTENVQKYEREYESTREDVKVTTQISTEIVKYEETETKKVTKREWSSEWKMDRAPAVPTDGDIPIEDPPVTPPPVDPPVTPPPVDPPVEPPVEPVPEYEDDEEEDEEVIIIDEEVPLTNIPDEEVPLTGVSSLWSLLSIASLGGLAVINAEEKKRRK